MKQLKNFLIKREQSQTRLSFAECEKSRLIAKLSLTLALLITAAAGAWAQGTTPEVAITNANTTASFTMPASDVTVNYMLVRDMNYATSPVTFSGLPTGDGLIVKKGSDGKYKFGTDPTFKLTDPLADNADIIAANGITVTVEKKNANNNFENSSTLADFLADAQPGTYRLTATATDENSPYDGTVTSEAFTVVEQYDLTVKPADDYSKGKVESVTVGTESVTIDANGEATKTRIAPDTEVKIKAKHGYIIEKVEVKKGAAAAKTIIIGDVELTYADGDTWETIVSKNSDKIKTLAGQYIVQVAQPASNQYRYIHVWYTEVKPSDIIDPSKSYQWDTMEMNF